MTTTQFDRITVNPERLNGQPCIRDLRITVKRVLENLALYPDRTELFEAFPELEEGDMLQALFFATTYFEDQISDFAYEASA